MYFFTFNIWIHTNMNSYYVWIHIFFAVIMYEFIYFLQCKIKAASARAPRARSASCKRTAWATKAKPELTSCPDQTAPDFCRSNPIVSYNQISNLVIESDQHIHMQFYMQHTRSNFIWLSHHVISDSVFLNGQQIHSERKTKKIKWKRKHIDPILHGFCTI